MAKIKTTFAAILTNFGFSPGVGGPYATFAHYIAEKDESGYQPSEHITVPVDAKKLTKLLNVTDVEITITVTPKGAKKPRKAKATKVAAPVVTEPTEPVKAE